MKEIRESKITLANLITEELNMFHIYVLIRTKANYNKVEIYNQIRALKGIVVVTIEKNSWLDSRATNQYEYSLLHMKYVASSGDALKDIEAIKMDALQQSKIPGLLQFIPRPKSITKLGGY